MLSVLQLVVFVPMAISSHTSQGDRWAWFVAPVALSSLLGCLVGGKLILKAVRAINIAFAALVFLACVLLITGISEWAYLGFDHLAAALFCTLMVFIPSAITGFLHLAV